MSDVSVTKKSYFEISGVLPGELRTELVRKSLHFLIALSPSMAYYNRPLTVIILMTGVLFYSAVESLRLAGLNVPVVSRLTTMAARGRDQGRFVLGPVTLGLGALLALLMYPSPAASVAIYALAFGDGMASLAGKFLGRLRPAFMLGKSIEGSSACFVAVFIASYETLHSYRGALLSAVTATVVEALPLEDYDNIALPVTVGMVVYLFI